MNLHIIADVQHTGRPDKPNDMGATFDLDSDGVRGENGEREVDIVRAYFAAMRAYLLAEGCAVTMIDSGTYGSRHATAIKMATADPRTTFVYAAGHANIGQGTYGLLRPDYRSANGRSLAEAIALELAAQLPELSKVRQDPLYPDAATAKKHGRDVSDAGKIGWWTRGWSCIDGAYSGPANLCGLLLEPIFLDSPAHRPLLTPAGLVRVGEALGKGVVAWRK